MTNGLSSPNNSRILTTGRCPVIVLVRDDVKCTSYLCYDGINLLLLAAVVFAVGWSVVILWVDHVWGDAIDDFVDRHGWF
jgi:hypothetical protein